MELALVVVGLSRGSCKIGLKWWVETVDGIDRGDMSKGRASGEVVGLRARRAVLRRELARVVGSIEYFQDRYPSYEEGLALLTVQRAIVEVALAECETKLRALGWL